MGKEKPILFNSAMVRAILEGRKTQTRRPFKYQPIEVQQSEMYPEDNYFKFGEDAPKSWQNHDGIFELHPMNIEFLWVRETFRLAYALGEEAVRAIDYKADDSTIYNPPLAEDEGCLLKREKNAKWTPSIHMPRYASRITLKVKRVWVERIQDISAEDCKKEGLQFMIGHNIKNHFHTLWKSCGYEWDSNPWVWCCEFEVVK